MSATSGTKQSRCIEQTYDIQAPVQDIWNALTQAEEITRWFAPDVEGTPGPNGRLTLRWSPEIQWEMSVVEWQPPHRLVLSDDSSESPEWPKSLGAPPIPMRIEYTLTNQGEGSVLRIVHSGFGTETSWDDNYDGTTGGWKYELRVLRHYLEHHRGKQRSMVLVRRRICVDRDEVARRILGQNGLGVHPAPESLTEGDRYTARDCNGATVSGTLLMRSPQTLFSGTVEQFDDAILRVEVCSCIPSQPIEAWVVLSYWGADAAVPTAFRKRWQASLDEMFPECSEQSSTTNEH